MTNRSDTAVVNSPATPPGFLSLSLSQPEEIRLSTAPHCPPESGWPYWQRMGYGRRRRAPRMGEPDQL
eukprot:6183344-Pleurochrysis_carterae.AAC.1